MNRLGLFILILSNIDFIKSDSDDDDLNDSPTLAQERPDLCKCDNVNFNNEGSMKERAQFVRPGELRYLGSYYYKKRMENIRTPDKLLDHFDYKYYRLYFYLII